MFYFIIFQIFKPNPLNPIIIKLQRTRNLCIHHHTTHILSLPHPIALLLVKEAETKIQIKMRLASKLWFLRKN